MPTAPTVAVYCRISKDPSRLEIGVNRQREDCVALANDLWPQCEVRLFIDNDVSAADPAVARPQWLAMLDALRGGEVDEIVAYDQSRLTRQPIKWEQLLVILGRRGIGSVQTVSEGERDVAEGGGRMVTRIMAAVDAEYTEVTRVRIRRALRRAVLSTVFERIEVHRATIRGYDPDLIRLVWHIPRGEQKPVLSPPSATRAN